MPGRRLSPPEPQGAGGSMKKMPSFHSVTTVETQDTAPVGNQGADHSYNMMGDGGDGGTSEGRGSHSSGGNNNSSIQQNFLDDDEDLPLRVWPVFSNRTEDGTIGIEDVLFIAEELGMECDGETLHQVIPGEKKGSLYFEECVDYLKKAVQSSREDFFRHDASGAERDETKVRKVSPVQGLLFLFGCESPRPVIDGKGKRLVGSDAYEVECALCFNAKTLLILSTLAVFIAVASAIVAFPATSWLNASIERSEATLIDFQSLVRIFSEQLESRIVKAHEDSILDTATTFARISEYLWGRSQETTFMYMENEVSIVQHAIVTDLNQRGFGHCQQMFTKLEALVNFAPHVVRTGSGALTAVMALAVIEEWDLTGMHLFVNSTAVSFSSQQRLRAPMPVSNYLHLEETYCDYSSFSNSPMGSALWTNTTTSSSVRTSGNTTISVISGYIPEASLLVCLVSDEGVLLKKAQEYAVEHVSVMNNLPRDNVLGSHHRAEVSLWTARSWTTSYTQTSASNIHLRSQDLVIPITPLEQDQRLCTLRAGSSSTGGGVEGCDEFQHWISSILNQTNYEDQGDLWHPYDLPNTTERIFSKEVAYYNGETALVSAKLIPETNAVVVVAIMLDLLKRDYKDRLIYTVEILNWAFVRTTEIVMSDRDEGTGKIIPQATSFRFNTTCYGVCNRFPESAQTALLAFRDPSGGGFIIPDYRPEPVTSLYAQLGEGLDLGLLIERDVQDLRGIVLRGITSIVDSINAAATLQREIIMLRWEDYQATRQFDRWAPCDENVFCLVRIPEQGIVFRGNCVSCVIRPPRDENTTFTYVTNLVKGPSACRPGEEHGQCNDNLELAQIALNMEVTTHQGEDQVAGTRLMYTKDYSDTPVVATVAYLDSLATAFVVTFEESSLRDSILLSISLSVASASALTAIGLVFVTFVTQRVLTNIEAEWKQYKSRIEAEKEKFGHFAQFMIPRHLLGQSKSGQSVICEPNPNAHIVVVDVAGLSALLHEHNARSLVRFLTYYTRLLDELSGRYGLFKLKMYGDVFVGVTQLGKQGVDQFLRENREHFEGTSAGQLHRMLQDPQSAPAAINVAAFSVLLLQLTSHEFTHTKWSGLPAKKKPNSQEMMEQGVECTQVDTLPLRIGIHTGSIVAGYVEMGRMPKYDCYGPALALASRMQLTCPTGKIHVTTYYKDELENIDGKLFFDYEPPRKTIVRGRGTVVSYVLRSAYVPVPDDFIAKLGIVRAHKPLFLERGATHSSNRDSKSSSRSSSYSRSDSSSAAGGGDGRGPGMGDRSTTNSLSDAGYSYGAPPAGGGSTQAGSIGGDSSRSRNPDQVL